jgi:signal transduction histidine kinase
VEIRVNNQHGAARQAAAIQAIKAVRKAVLSMPGKLLGLSIGFVLLAEILIFFPSAANYRSDWLSERTDDAYLASLAVETADEMGLGDEMIANLLTSADAVIVGRVYDGMNVPLLARPGGIGAAPVMEVMLAEENLFERIFNTIGVFLAPEGRYLLIIDEPMAGEAGLVSVVVPEAGLKRDLYAYSGRVLWLSIFIAVMTGGLIYLCLMFMFVRPMRKLAQAMTQFQQDPGNPACTVALSRRSDEIGEAESALAAMQDEVRTAFRQRERLAALGGAVARINHDLRNVLTSAQLISDRLSTNADERVAAMGARLVRAVDRGIRLCEDTLQYGRSEERPPELQPVWLRAALDDAAGDAFAATGAADWRNEIDALMQVQADPDHLHRIFLNLFRNALQAMEKSDAPLIHVRARLSREGEHVLVEVCDTGPGVPDRIAETLFEPFGRTGSKGGSGLGLSIVRELARVMGGDVYLKTGSEPGAVFEVRLPAMGG